MVAGLLCPNCGKFTKIEELKGQKWPEWSNYGSVTGYINPITGELLEGKDYYITYAEHDCGFEADSRSVSEFEVNLYEDGTVEAVGEYWLELLGSGRFRLVKVDAGEYSYLAFVPAGRDKVQEGEAVIEPVPDETNLPYLPAKEENGEIVLLTAIGGEL